MNRHWRTCLGWQWNRKRCWHLSQQLVGLIEERLGAVKCFWSEGRSKEWVANLCLDSAACVQSLLHAWLHPRHVSPWANPQLRSWYSTWQGRPRGRRYERPDNFWMEGSTSRIKQEKFAVTKLAMVPCLEPISKRIKNQKLHTLCTINYIISMSDLAQWKDLI